MYYFPLLIEYSPEYISDKKNQVQGSIHTLLISIRAYIVLCVCLYMYVAFLESYTGSLCLPLRKKTGGWGDRGKTFNF